MGLLGPGRGAGPGGVWAAFQVGLMAPAGSTSFPPPPSTISGLLLSGKTRVIRARTWKAGRSDKPAGHRASGPHLWPACQPKWGFLQLLRGPPPPLQDSHGRLSGVQEGEGCLLIGTRHARHCRGSRALQPPLFGVAVRHGSWRPGPSNLVCLGRGV